MSLFGSEARYLVFSSIGDINCVYHWLADSDRRNFDLITYYYGDDSGFVTEADLLVKRKGLKYENFYHCMRHYDLTNYDAVWVVDDDIVMRTDAINRMFNIFGQFDLYLAQPSYCPDSEIHWEITRKRQDCLIRFTNFVENGVALFSKSVLETFEPTFKNAKTGWGIDLIWPVLLGFPTNKIAVIDEVCCVHPKNAPSSLDRVVPRPLHRRSGISLLKRYGIVPAELSATAHWSEVVQFLPFEVQEYSRIEIKA